MKHKEPTLEYLEKGVLRKALFGVQVASGGQSLLRLCVLSEEWKICIYVQHGNICPSTRINFAVHGPIPHFVPTEDATSAQVILLEAYDSFVGSHCTRGARLKRHEI